MQYFGFSDPVIKKLITQLPNADILMEVVKDLHTKRDSDSSDEGSPTKKSKPNSENLIVPDSQIEENQTSSLPSEPMTSQSSFTASQPNESQTIENSAIEPKASFKTKTRTKKTEEATKRILELFEQKETSHLASSIQSILEEISEKARQGQQAFVTQLAVHYFPEDAKQCFVTGSSNAIDASHIRPYSETGDHNIDNGFLLRKDLHFLFDQYKWSLIHEGKEYYRIELGPELLQDECYNDLHGQRFGFTEELGKQIFRMANKEAISLHYSKFKQKNQ